MYWGLLLPLGLISSTNRRGVLKRLLTRREGMSRFAAYLGRVVSACELQHLIFRETY